MQNCLFLVFIVILYILNKLSIHPLVPPFVHLSKEAALIYPFIHPSILPSSFLYTLISVFSVMTSHLPIVQGRNTDLILVISFSLPVPTDSTF